MSETFWIVVGAGTSSTVSCFLSVAMDFIASGAGAGFWEIISWYLLFYGTLSAICLSPFAKNKILLVAFSVLVLCLAVGHCFYLDYISSAFDDYIVSLSPNGTSSLTTNGTLPRHRTNSNATLARYAAIQAAIQADYYTTFTFLVFWTEVVIFMLFFSPVVVMVFISWCRVWKGRPIAHWQESISMEGAMTPPPAQGILKNAASPRTVDGASELDTFQSGGGRQHRRDQPPRSGRASLSGIDNAGLERVAGLRESSSSSSLPPYPSPPSVYMSSSPVYSNPPPSSPRWDAPLLAPARLGSRQPPRTQ